VKRRALLAAAGSSLAVVAGCAGSRPTPERQRPDERTTATFDGRPAAELERRELPEPPTEPSVDAAQEFVRRYERTVLYNDLVDQAPGDDTPVRTEVSAVRTDVLAEPDRTDGVLVASDGRASIRRESGGYTRNRTLVVHYVAAGDHRVQQYNAYRCAEPSVQTGGDQTPAKLQLYDFSDGDGARVSVAVDDRATGERTFFARHDFGELGLVLQPGVLADPGRFDVAVATQDGGVDSLAWAPARGTPSWWGLTVFVLPGGDVLASVLDPELPVSYEDDLCGVLDY
jgi:hypothetical protein